MKKIILVIIFLQIVNSIQCQNTWEYFRKENDIYEGTHMMIELKGGNYISTGGKYLGINSDDENKNFAFIRKHLNNNCEVYLEKTYTIDSLAVSLEFIFYNSDNETYTIVGSAYKYFDNKKRGYFLVTHWDSELNLKNDTIIRLQPLSENNFLHFLSGIYSIKNEYIILGNYVENLQFPFRNNKLFFARVSKNGTIIFNNYYKEIYGRNQCSIIEEPSKNRYALIGPTTYFFDNNFNKIDSLITLNSIDYLFKLNFNAVNFPNEKYLCSVNFDGNSYRGLGLFDSNLNLLNSINISKQISLSDNSLVRKNFDYIDTSFIFVGSQAIDYGYFTIAKVNSNLRPYWIKYYSENDNFKHVLIGLTAITDGGCIIYGVKGESIEFSVFPINYGSWALKLDAYGNTVSTHDPESNAWEITVFPNPSAGDFKIDISGQSSEAKLMLFDTQGREVKSYADLHTGTNTFIFDKLPQGTYIWKLLTKEKEIGEGKWVKLGL